MIFYFNNDNYLGKCVQTK